MVGAVTLPAITENVADVAPCGIVIVAGTLAAVVLELESNTDKPPVPAGAVRLIVPVPDRPLTSVVGLAETPLNAGWGGATVTANVALVPE